ncbi:formate dehydrogenase [Cohnella xylanilytica]|uniref:DinB family protein n=1 Tax=Cohnella xylanilytica TaxID=557555 RepID=A0A841UAA1_9BACL|nr:DinB family protein [Cohnella xylanilytica]MBB6694891.1 DinB family protein [Cohnella xylanilytica]GIO14372.1 formate dehydrogenase [Cohnella xylanilytica]
MTQSIIDTGKVLRQIVIGQLLGVEENRMDVRPEGFNNTVRWNVGHVAYWMDKYSTLSFGTPSNLPASYETLFNSGTKPEDWTFAPPSKEELIGTLAAQLDRLSEVTPDRLDRPLDAPFEMGPFRFETAGELFNFALMHEAIHLGVVSSQLKLIS